jgi:O-antigen ligase
MDMAKLLEILTILVIVGATLAFGGVHPITYSLAEAVMFLAVALLLIKQLRQGKIRLPLPIWPLLFTLWVLMQIIPLPHQIIAALFPARLAGPGLLSLSISHGQATTPSIDPHETVVALFKFLAYLSVFLLAAELSDTRKKKSALVKTLIFLGCFEAGYGIVQYLTGWQKIFTYTKVFDLYEATGTYINRNHFAGLLEMTLPFVFASAFYSFQRSFEFPRSNGGEGTAGSSMKFQALFYSFLLVLVCVALVFSRSRGGILSAIFSLIFVFLLGQMKIRRKGWMLFMVLLLTVVIGYGFWIGLNPVLIRFEQIGEKGVHQTEARTDIWKDTYALARENPLAGTGLGTFGLAYRRFQTVALDKYVDHAHNDYLENLSDTGMVGFGLLFLPILYLFIRMIVSYLNDSHRYRRSVLLGCIGSTLAMLVHSLVDFNLQIPANALIFALVLGIGYKTACVEPREQRSGSPQF